MGAPLGGLSPTAAEATTPPPEEGFTRGAAFLPASPATFGWLIENSGNKRLLVLAMMSLMTDESLGEPCLCHSAFETAATSLRKAVNTAVFSFPSPLV